eukprot:13896638-Heterocapsa_arctica.AAC.1
MRCDGPKKRSRRPTARARARERASPTRARERARPKHSMRCRLPSSTSSTKLLPPLPGKRLPGTRSPTTPRPHGITATGTPTPGVTSDMPSRKRNRTSLPIALPTR